VARARRKKTQYRPNAEGGVLRETGDQIRRARVLAKITQEDAAERARIDYKRWQALEEGRANPTLRTLIRVAEALETDFWGLMRAPERRRAKTNATR
jgi:transcriptional regulator with XRE-family HTH domain